MIKSTTKSEDYFFHKPVPIPGLQPFHDWHLVCTLNYMLLTVYLMSIIRNSELSLLEHQKARLNQAAYLFDQNLNGSLDDYLAGHHAANKSKQEQILIMSEFLNTAINKVHREYPEVHIGLYNMALDVFFDGTQRFGENFSMRLKKAFEDVLKNKTAVMRQY